MKARTSLLLVSMTVLALLLSACGGERVALAEPIEPQAAVVDVVLAGQIQNLDEEVDDGAEAPSEVLSPNSTMTDEQLSKLMEKLRELELDVDKVMYEMGLSEVKDDPQVQPTSLPASTVQLPQKSTDGEGDLAEPDQSGMRNP